ncbi:Cobalamin biosynthesis protein CobD OS=Streptomyces alboniger OX=132473 GN=cobD PE=3 SV=1 [Streptomyces alboniger]
MSADRDFAYGAAAGFLGDLLLGDPRRGHPVAAFGRAAGAVERVLWRDHRGWGALHTVVCAGGAAGAAVLASSLLRRSPAGSVALTAAATWAVVGGTSLGREARAIGGALRSGDIEVARERLPHLCGRDPQALDADGIARAVVESVAENTSDAVVGALVWGAVGGVPGLVAFRAVNTLDAMVGHKSPRYRRYGWASARLDDVFGWPGARLTAALAVLAGDSPRGAVRAWRADASKHPSQRRAGRGGLRGGAGRTARRDPLVRGTGRGPAGTERSGRAVRAADIERAVKLSRRVGLLALGVTVAARLKGRPQQKGHVS